MVQMHGREDAMTTWQQMARLLHDRSGNFGMMTAILLPVLLGVGGVALDLTNMMMSKTQLQEASDSAALAAATALANGDVANEAAAEALAKQFFLGQMGNYMGADAASALAASTDVDINTTTSTAGKKFTVSVGTSYNLALTPLMGMLGYQTMNIATNSVSTSGTEKKTDALSLYLVLDQSGSMAENTNTKIEKCYVIFGFKSCWMGYQTKMEALKEATANLLGELDKVDPDQKFVRTGAVSYNEKMQKAYALDWGTANALFAVNGLEADGRTNSGEAMQKAYALLADPMENSYHDNMNGDEEPSKYIVFMTDGENNVNGADSKTLNACDNAKKAGMEVYAIAFMAPDAGQELLSACASSPAHYFEPEDATALTEAFKAIGQKAAKSATRLSS